MIWLAWRRRRGAVIATAAALLIAAMLLWLTGRSMWSEFQEGGLAACIEGLGGARWVPVSGGCQDEAQAFAARFFSMRLLGLVLFTFVPLVIGMFWGAPTIAREIEDDTISLVWTQGMSRRRWAWTQRPKRKLKRWWRKPKRMPRPFASARKPSTRNFGK